MRYVSTRGGAPGKRFTEILLEGLAPDGGLYVPESYPRANLKAWRALSYPELAFAVLSQFIDDVPNLESLIQKTYTKEVFGSEEIAPLKTLEPGLHLLRLSNGPTFAFKDMAMQFLGHLFEYELNRKKEELNILGATSGDTGSAAEYAMRGKRNIRVFMLSPKGRMSPFQTAQMYSLKDQNIFNLEVNGVFDNCQDAVKAVMSDAGFKMKYRIGAVNSINWARVAAQVVYYFKGYFFATRSDEEEVSFSVPSGNFGNIYAGHVARNMGLPIKKLVVATNENNVLDEFFRTGTYCVRSSEAVHPTSSPSMDISKASNFERYMFDLVGRDGKRVKELWKEVELLGRFDISGPDFRDRIDATGFASGSSTHADRVATIQSVFRKYNTMIDPHTADGVKVGIEHREPKTAMICLETALPVKFAETIREALGRDPERPKGTEGLENFPKWFKAIRANEQSVKEFIRAHVSRTL